MDKVANEVEVDIKKEFSLASCFLASSENR
jgi:hypothetical protein